MATMNADYQKDFLAKTRYGYLTTLTKDGTPKTVPVWFDWDDHMVRIFSVAGTAKLKRIEKDSRATVLVASEMNEHEAWVSFDGHAKIRSEGAIELVEKLAAKYWDLSNPEKRDTIERWKKMPEIFRVIEITPTRIRTYFD
jgi:PPOX class probable F420-dependent enzyme